MTSEEEFESLIDAEQNHYANEIRFLEQNIDTLEYILSANYEEFIDIIDFYEEELPKRDNRKTLIRKVQYEYQRRLHNYLASYYSLYDQTQNIQSNYLENRGDEYNELLSEHQLDPISTFLRRFRVYVHHVELPPLQAVERYSKREGQPDIQRKILFKRDELLEWDGWNAAEAFLEEMDEEILLKETFAEYQDRIEEFNSDFKRLIRDEYSEELEEHSEIMNEIAKEVKIEKKDDGDTVS